MNRPHPILAAALVLVAPAAFAQADAAASGTGDKPVTSFQEIERGFYVGVSGGPFFMVNPPVAPRADGTMPPRPFSPGQTAQLEVGLDLGDRLSVGGWVMGAQNRAGSEYVGYSGGQASGDFSTLVFGGVARLNLVGFKDAQEVPRTWFYLRGGAGYAMFAPNNLLDRPDVLVFAGPGVEYYTRLRHFSVGVEVAGTYLLTSGAFGFAVTPNLRYAF
jgi:hypothetical protein